jgi:hypothetical protein
MNPTNILITVLIITILNMQGWFKRLDKWEQYTICVFVGVILSIIFHRNR